MKKAINKKTIPDGGHKKRRSTAGILAVVLAGASIMGSCTGPANAKRPITTHQQESTIQNMKSILIIGINPATIDFTNPELPKGLTREMVEQGTRATLDKLKSMGYDAAAFFVDTGAKDLTGLVAQLKSKHYDGIVVGNGIRGQAANFILFEQIINVIHTYAAGAKIIFNTLPTNTDEAVKRWL